MYGPIYFYSLNGYLNEQNSLHQKNKITFLFKIWANGYGSQAVYFHFISTKEEKVANIFYYSNSFFN